MSSLMAILVDAFERGGSREVVDVFETLTNEKKKALLDEIFSNIVMEPLILVDSSIVYRHIYGFSLN